MLRKPKRGSLRLSAGCVNKQVQMLPQAFTWEEVWHLVSGMSKKASLNCGSWRPSTIHPCSLMHSGMALTESKALVGTVSRRSANLGNARPVLRRVFVITARVVLTRDSASVDLFVPDKKGPIHACAQ